MRVLHYTVCAKGMTLGDSGSRWNPVYRGPPVGPVGLTYLL